MRLICLAAVAALVASPALAGPSAKAPDPKDAQIAQLTQERDQARAQVNLDAAVIAALRHQRDTATTEQTQERDAEANLMAQQYLEQARAQSQNK